MKVLDNEADNNQEGEKNSSLEMIHEIEDKYKGEISQKNEKIVYLESDVKENKGQIVALNASLELER